MDTSWLITKFRFMWGGLDVNQITDTNALLLINMSYRDNINKIRQEVWENFFYDEWYIDSIADTTNYALQRRNDTTGVAWMVEVSWVSVKYTEEGEYEKARPETIGNKENDLNWYSENQNKANPFFILGSNSFSIYPKTDAVVTKWMFFYWISDPADLLIGWDESSVKIPLEHHDSIVFGALYYYYKSERMINEKIDALNDYKMEQNEMISELWERFSTTLISEMPDTNHLT